MHGQPTAQIDAARGVEGQGEVTGVGREYLDKCLYGPAGLRVILPRQFGDLCRTSGLCTVAGE